MRRLISLMMLLMFMTCLACAGTQATNGAWWDCTADPLGCHEFGGTGDGSGTVG